MQRAYGFFHIVFFDHEADVNLRRALRNHTHVCLRQRAKDFGRDTASTANILAHQTDDRLASFILHIGKLLQVGSDGRNCLGGIDSQRDADFRGGDHVHWTAMVVEHFEDALQESVRHEHARGDDVDDGDAPFGGNRLEVVAALRRAGSDARTLAGWITRIEYKNGNVFLHSRKQRGWM